MRFYDIYSDFFKFLKILDFLKVFPKISIFRNFGGQKLKIVKFRDSYFVERVILHLYWSFCAVCFKILFLANFLTLSRLWSKSALKRPHKKVNFSKGVQPILTKFGHSMSTRCRIRYTTFCADILQRIYKSAKGGGPRARRAPGATSP